MSLGELRQAKDDLSLFEVAGRTQKCTDASRREFLISAFWERASRLRETCFFADVRVLLGASRICKK